MSDGGIRATQCPNVNDPQVLNDQEILKIVKSHFLLQKNHNFFVKYVSYGNSDYTYGPKTLWAIFHEKIIPKL